MSFLHFSTHLPKRPTLAMYLSMPNSEDFASVTVGVNPQTSEELRNYANLIDKFFARQEMEAEIEFRFDREAS